MTRASYTVVLSVSSFWRVNLEARNHSRSSQRGETIIVDIAVFVSIKTRFTALLDLSRDVMKVESRDAASTTHVKTSTAITSDS